MVRAALLVLWLLAIAAAIRWVDVPVSTWLRDAKAASHVPDLLLRAVRLPGHFAFTLAIVSLLAIWHSWKWRAGVLLGISGALSGIIVHVLKWSVGRQRPVTGIDHAFTLHPFAGGLPGLFDPPKNLSFPSGDTALAFATAACLAIWLPRWQLAFYAWALLVAAHRLVTLSHYPSEVIAAAGIGVLCVPPSRWLLRRMIGLEPDTRNPNSETRHA